MKLFSILFIVLGIMNLFLMVNSMIFCSVSLLQQIIYFLFSIVFVTCGCFGLKRKILFY